ncbi:TIGR02117 family protein [Filimonas effusa]|uniref:TIGR02117 family protein n=1 Tax=Filimonas effusa TaxID=2508721 RepID=A0A4Q1D241_9BACT|nr:TIGR02117 family protein [Filimonas effusa]RXK81948.1 TIGR02117 family protein [Filimonas effusa]
MKLLLKYTGITLLSIVAFVLLYLGSAWVLSRIPVKAETAGQPAVEIYLLSNGVHTDIVMPVKTEYRDWSSTILYSNTRSNDSSLSYIAFGWGDKGFYLETPTWADLKARTAFRAAFGLSTSAVHATFYKKLTEGAECVKTTISPSQYQRLIAYIDNGLQKNSNGAPIVIPTEARYGANDAFYEARGSYTLFHTCNTWTNNALKASGQKACLWTPFDSGIFYQYRKH